MSVLRPDESSRDLEDIIFLYRLVPGHAFLSYGLHCALLAGVPDEVVKRASSVLDTIGQNRRVERLSNEKISCQDQYKMSTSTQLYVAVEPRTLADVPETMVTFLVERRSRELHNYTRDNILVTVNERVIRKICFSVFVDTIDDLTNEQLVASCIHDGRLTRNIFLSDEEFDFFARQIASEVTLITNMINYENGRDILIRMKKVETLVVDVHQEERKSKPASELSLSKLERLMFHGDDDEACVLCREEFTSETKVTRMPCNHMFHHSCLLNWLQRNNSCPTCRYEQDED